RLSANYLTRLHRWSFSASGLHDAVRVLTAALLGTGAFVTLVFLLRLLSPPRSVIVVEFLLTVVLMLGMRFGPRVGLVYWNRLALVRNAEAKRTLIVGAAAAGEMLLRDLQRSGEHPYRV